MIKTYELYFRAGKEPMQFKTCMVAEDVKDIIQQAIKMMQSLIGYSDVEKQIIIKYGCKQVFNATF